MSRTSGSTAAKAEQRVKRVREFLQAGMTQVDIAQVLAVHVNTIARDVALIRKENEERVRGSRADQEIGDHLSFLDGVEEKALADYHAESGKPAARANFLSIALRARAMKIELQQTTGVLPKAADKVEIEQLFRTETGADIRSMSSDELEKLEQGMLVQMATMRKKKDKSEKDEDDAPAAKPAVAN